MSFYRIFAARKFYAELLIIYITPN